MILEGIYRKNKKGFGFVKIEGQGEEIFIAKHESMNALNGDKVNIKLINENQNSGKRHEGRVVKILERKQEKIVGIFQRSKNFGFVVPDDRNFGTDIFISKKDCKNAKNNSKVVVKITKFPKKGKNAEGKIIEILGNVNQAGVDMLSLIKQYDLPDEFPENVLNEARNFGIKINEKELFKRRDIREKIIFTIDGEDAKDLDDAVSVEKLDNGNYRLDVHIADVSYYVRENSLLDREALIRGTSIYMLGQVIPMLPRELSNGLCSLNVGEDRLALSCSMTINQNGKVLSSDVYKSVIKVTERMSYHDVQSILDNSNKQVVEKYSKYNDNFKLMEELALILKERRLKQGYLNLNVPETQIDLDEYGRTKNICRYETSFANEIIEQFMLTANETIAEKFYWLEAPFIYRVHEEPDLDRVKELNKFLYNYKMKIKVANGKVYPAEFSKILEQIKDKPEEKVISTLILRTLKLARYEAENKGHFGIASKYYCHFTSPIRRYPDLFIHRIISKYLESNYVVSNKFIEKYSEEAEQRAKESSEREKVATKVERESEDIKKAEYMENKIGEEYDGIISSITSFGMFVELENTVEGFVSFDRIPGTDYFIYDEERKNLVGKETKKVYKIGDSVKIKVISASKLLRQVDFEIIDEEKD